MINFSIALTFAGLVDEFITISVKGVYFTESIIGGIIAQKVFVQIALKWENMV